MVVPIKIIRLDGLKLEIKGKLYEADIHLIPDKYGDGEYVLKLKPYKQVSKEE